VVSPVPAPAASFAAAPAEADLDDLAGGRFGAVAACASACRASARIGVSAATARRLGLGRRAATLGSAAVRRGAAGTAKLVVRVGRRARAALRGRARVGATVAVTVREGAGAPLTVKRKVTLLRTLGPARIARRGLRYTVACARTCSLGGSATIAPRSARRLGLRPGEAKRYRLASGTATVGRTPKLLKLGVRRAARGPLRVARKVSVLVELTAGRAPEPSRTASLSRTLRR
jgi:hypothetical protein